MKHIVLALFLMTILLFSPMFAHTQITTVSPYH